MPSSSGAEGELQEVEVLEASGVKLDMKAAWYESPARLLGAAKELARRRRASAVVKRDLCVGLWSKPAAGSRPGPTRGPTRGVKSGWRWRTCQGGHRVCTACPLVRRRRRAGAPDGSVRTWGGGEDVLPATGYERPARL